MTIPDRPLDGRAGGGEDTDLVYNMYTIKGNRVSLGGAVNNSGKEMAR